MKHITFEVEIDVADDASATGALDSLRTALSFLDDEGHLMDEDFTEYSVADIVMVDISDSNDWRKSQSITEDGPISWEDAGKIAADYELVLSREEKDGHELYIDEHDTLRWVEHPIRAQEIMDSFRAKDMNELFMNGADKNDPIVRELYKCIGYSLCGFWEIFYWEVNNERANEYVAPTKD